MGLDESTIAEWSDSELTAARTAVIAEQERRIMLRSLPAQIADFLGVYQRAAGVHAEPGAEWTPPTGYLDAYLADAVVLHNGARWVALRNGVTAEPGVAPADWGPAPED